MNEKFDLLAKELAIDRRKLLEALYAIRAPSHLVGLIPATRQFRDWRRKFPALENLPNFPEYPDCLHVLDLVADLEIDDDELTGRSTERFSTPWTPLRPYTGDSVIGELLLVRAGEGIDAGAFEQSSAWLLWVAQNFHLQQVDHLGYEQYLLQDGERLAARRHGNRLYGAYLALRRLAEPAQQDVLSAFAELTSEISVRRCQELTLLAQLGQPSITGETSLSVQAYVRKHFDYAPVVLRDAVLHLQKIFPPEIRLVLQTVWGEALDRQIGLSRTPRKFYTRDIQRPQIRRGQRLTEMLLHTDAGVVHSGTVAEFFPRDDRAAEGKRFESAEDDPEEEEHREPVLSLFLADSDDLIRGYYAAKGAQVAVEYENAQLHWSRWTLSREAIDAVSALVAGHRGSTSDALDRRARLAIGLSLLTGRALDEVALVRISANEVQVDEAAPVAIRLDTKCLVIHAGTPDLRHRTDKTHPLCFPTAKTLSLPMPCQWYQLLNLAGSDPAKRKSGIVRRARKLIVHLPGELQVTEKGVRDAFVRALGHYTRGDLGAQKAISDGAQASSRNIIHYASYDVKELESWWRKAAETLVGELPESSTTLSSKTCVGAQHAFDVDELARYFAEVKQRIEEAKSSDDWPRAFNLMTLYLAYWLGLGVAGRRSIAPVPYLFLDGGWALVADKHRSNGSTDRVVPLTMALRRQIDAYVAFAMALAITVPDLDPVADSEHGSRIRLQYIHRRKGVIPYQPKYQEQDEKLTSLPGNWGRKVVRSESTGLPGRYRDAGLGHWVRGRHALDATSTFDMADFRKCWLNLQTGLEERLGFELVTMTQYAAVCSRLRIQPAQSNPPEPSNPHKAPPDGASGKSDAERILKETHPHFYETLRDVAISLDHGVVLEQVRKVISGQQHRPVGELRCIAEAVCAYIRRKRKIPIYAIGPRQSFSNKVVLDAVPLQTLSYLQQDVIDRFRADLEYLPAHSRVSGKKASKTRRVELGRLVMIAIWRLGLTSWNLIESWLRALHSSTPILAQGNNRYMTFTVKSTASRELLHRTVFLDAFSNAYLVVEQQALRGELLPPLFGGNPKTKAARRRTAVYAALRAYLRHLGATDCSITVPAMCAAASQWIMLQSAPVVAAYARAEWMTEDLGDAQLRRLGGLTPVRRSASMAANVLDPTRELDLGPDDLPQDLRDRGPALLRVLGPHRSRRKAEWRRLIGSYKAASPVEALLCQFALWLLARAETQSGGGQLSTRQKRYLTARPKIIAYSLLGYAVAEPGWNSIDGDTLAILQEATRDQFPDRLQHGAWYQFYQFLADKKADHGIFKVGPLGAPPERAVSAKVMSRDELEALHTLLLSARSGIGNAALRASAQRHVELMATFGLRRSESAHLRWLDHQRDAIRVQAYGDHTLKTAWATRMLPVEFARPSTKAWAREARNKHYQHLIDPGPGGVEPGVPANPDNFFDALSRLIKSVTGDQSMGSHHLRHTMISRLVLTLLRRSAGLDTLFDDLPWLEGLIVDRDSMDALLGSEGDAGQGLRSVAALVGHSHPLTTLRHYVHVMCIALYGTLRKADTLDMSRSFERRIGGTSTVQRWATQARAEVATVEEVDDRRRAANNVLRDHIERRLASRGVDRDETLHIKPAFQARSTSAEWPRGEISFDRLERIDRSLRDAHNLLDDKEVEPYRVGLARLATLVSGKKGSHVPRHPLMEVRPSIWVPQRLAAGTATQAASGLCDWLESLRVNQPEEFEWLVQRWTFASERERGRIRLDDSGDAARARQLSDSQRAVVSIEGTAISNSRGRKTTGSTRRMRLKCIGLDGEPVRRDTQAVRWVMSYVAAKCLVAS